MQFIDFKDNPKELIGKLVLVENRYNKSIHRITRITKTSFGINDSDMLFGLTSGYQRASGWHTFFATLITESEANEYRKQWAEQKEAYALRTEITESLKTATLEQLRKIKSIITE